VTLSNRFSVLPVDTIHEIGIDSHFHIPIQLQGRNRAANLHALVDCGASTVFINRQFVNNNHITTYPYRNPISVYNIDGTINMDGALTHYADLKLMIGTHVNQQHFAVTNIGPEDVIIGIDWLREHDPDIGWKAGTLELNKCPLTCRIELPRLAPPLKREVLSRAKKVEKAEPPTTMLASNQFLNLMDITPQEEEEYPCHGECEPGAQVDCPSCSRTWTTDPQGYQVTIVETEGPEEDVSLPNAGPIPSRKPTFWTEEDDDMQEDLDHFTLAYISTLTEGHHTNTANVKHPRDVRLAATVDGQEPVDWKELVPPRYHEFGQVFSKEAARRLPEHREWDHAINFDPEQPLPKPQCIFPLSPAKKKAQEEYIEDMLSKGYIRRSKSELAAPMFFVDKKDGTYRAVQDYRAVNNITIPDREPIPLSTQIIDDLQGYDLFTELDLRVGFYNVRIKEGDEWKAAFRTDQGLYEPLVLMMGLKNAPPTFQRVMNILMAPLVLAGKARVYLDNVYIMGRKSQIEQHHADVKEALRIFADNDLYAKPEKCKFDQTTIECLGMIISDGRVAMDPAKVEGVLSWPTPKKVKEVQSFLGFANFYRRFIESFGHLARPLHALTRKDQPWLWQKEQQEAFDELKKRFCTAPVLTRPDTAKPFILETDASDYAVGAILSQKNEDDEWHPTAYFSKSFTEAERNYEIYDKELGAIVKALEEYQHYLEGAKEPVEILTDHKNLEYFMTAQSLTRRQARWSLFLSRFNFILKHRPGKLSAKPDALSRRPDHHPGKEDNQGQILLKPSYFISKATQRGHMRIAADKPLLQRIRDSSLQDQQVTEALNLLHTKGPRQLRKGLEEWNVEDRLILYRGKVYVPKDDAIRRDLVKLHHDTLQAGHPGRWKTYELLSRNYWWPGMSTYVDKYVDGCESCARNKNFPQKRMGLLQPNEVPNRPWGIVTCDFITKLPDSRGFSAIMVAVDRLTKMAHFIPTTDNVNAETAAQLYMKRVFRQHGTPDKVITDRGPQYDSDLMRELFKSLGIEPSFSTAYHPQTDGQTERVNQTLEQYIRHFCNYKQDNWVDLLCHAEFAYNNTAHSATKVSPFYAYTGQHPSFIPSALPTYKSPAAEDIVKEIQSTQDEIKAALEVAAEQMKRHYDRRVDEAPDFQPGDMVYLDGKNVHTSQPARKFARKRHGPFKIIEKIGKLNYRLELPDKWTIHDVFHVVLLKKAEPDQIPGRQQAAVPVPDIVPPPVHQELFAIEKIIDNRMKNGALEYKVKWQGYPNAQNTWEPASNLDETDPVIIAYRTANPTAPRRLSATAFAQLQFKPRPADGDPSG
jgi:hypothetical protein